MTQSNAASDAALGRLPRVLHEPVRWLMATWPGRVVLRTAAAFARIEIFDRSMTIAAQFFTSVFPILIMVAAWAGKNDADRFASAVDMPEQTKAVLQNALDAQNGTNAFGVLGALIVLISATSLSRALTRAFDAVWELPKARRGLGSAWRWVAAVLVLALAMVLTRIIISIADGIPPQHTWDLVAAAAVYGGIAIFVPWILMAGRVAARWLIPSGVVFAVVMIIAQPISRAYLPRALGSSAAKYGSIGVAFTYIAWLYVMSFIFLGAAVTGRAIALDEGWLGRRVRGRERYGP